MGRKKLPKGEAAADRRVTVVNLKGEPELKTWLDEAAASVLSPASAVVRAAMVLWAKHNNFRMPPGVQDAPRPKPKRGKGSGA